MKNKGIMSAQGGLAPGKKKLKFFALALLVVVLVAIPLLGKAAGPKIDNNIYIGPDQVINHNLYKVGNTIIIDGDVNGDVFVVGKMISIRGTVAGHVFAAGNAVVISGQVDGSVFAAGSNVTVSGAVAGTVMSAGSNVSLLSGVLKNVYLAGANVSITPDASVGQDLVAAGASVSISGPVIRNAELAGANVLVDAQVGNNVKVKVDNNGQLTLSPKADILGNLTYQGRSKDILTSQAGAVVEGETIFNAIKAGARSGTKIELGFLSSIFAFMTVIWIFGLIIVGLVLIAMIPKIIKQTSEVMVKEPLSSMGWGVIYLILTPVVSIILLFTIIGAPLGGMVMVMYFISLYVVQVLVSITMGAAIISRVKKNQEPGLVWSLVVGAIVFVIITAIPLLGWFLKILAIVWALGAVVSVKKKILKDFR